MDIVNQIFSVQTIDSIVRFFQDSQAGQIILILKIVSGVLSFAMFCAIIFFLIKSGYIKLAYMQDIFELVSFRSFGQKKIARIWDSISGKLEKAPESEYKMAVVEAENILDDVFMRMGLSGQTFSERLSQVSPVQLRSLDKVSRAHQIRNKIVHDPDYKLNTEEAKEAIKIYEQALKELDVF